MSLFVTGTDTGVGKTYTAASLLRLAKAAGIRCVGFKPICCGDRNDAELLLGAGSDGATIDEVNPVWLKTPAAPLAARRVEEADINPAQLITALARLQERFEFVVVEGVGGWMVPIRRDYFVSDLAAEMQLPVVIVALNRLGCLNHTMLTVRAVAASGLRCAGVVLNSLAPAPEDYVSSSNVDIIRELSGVEMLPRLSADTAELPAAWRSLLP